MKTINNTFKSKVFKAAWTSIRNGKSQTFSQALKSAWAWAKKTLSEGFISLAGKSIVRETEKAIAIAIILEECVSEQSITRNIWVPKSLVKDNSIPQWFVNKKFEEELSTISQNFRNVTTIFFA